MIADLLIWQYRTKPKARKTVSFFKDLHDLTVQNVIKLLKILDVDTTTGIGLDLVGQRVGVSRTLNFFIPKDNYFGWADDEDAKGFDIGDWYQYGDALEDTVVLNDEDYRFLIKAKILKNYQRADIADIVASVKYLFGEDANVIDNYDMTMHVILPENSTSTFIDYVIRNLDILRRPICVGYKFFEVRDHSFGWYEDETAFGFDDGEWSDFVL